MKYIKLFMCLTLLIFLSLSVCMVGCKEKMDNNEETKTFDSIDCITSLGDDIFD